MSNTDLNSKLDIRHNLTLDELLYALNEGFVVAPEVYASIQDGGSLSSNTFSFGNYTLVADEALSKVAMSNVQSYSVNRKRAINFVHEVDDLAVEKTVHALNGLIAEEVLKGHCRWVDPHETIKFLTFGGDRRIYTLEASDNLVLAYCRDRGIDFQIPMNGEVPNFGKFHQMVNDVRYGNEDFKIWVNEKFSPTIEKTYIPNSKSQIGSGMLEASPELVLQSAKQFRAVSEEDYLGIDSIRTLFSQTYASPDEIVADKHRFVDQDSAIYGGDELDGKLNFLMREMLGLVGSELNLEFAKGEFYRCLKSYGELGMECFAGTVFDAVRFDDYSYSQLNDFIASVESAPSEYAGGKLYEAVPLSQFKGVLLPESAEAGLKERLEEYGLAVVTYKDLDNVDRLEKMTTLSSDLDALKVDQKLTVVSKMKM